MRGLILFTTLVLSARAHSNTLSAPLYTLLSPSQLAYVLDDVARTCPKFSLSRTTPVREVVSPAFWTQCLEPRRYSPRQGIKRDHSPFYERLKRGAEFTLREALAPQWLTLDMTAEDVARHVAGESLFDLKPLSYIEFKGVGGRSVDPRRLKDHGLFVVRDFLKAFNAELGLPRGQRFIKNYKPKGEVVLRYKEAIDRDLGRPIDVKGWLSSTKQTHADDPALARACALLLEHLSKADS